MLVLEAVEAAYDRSQVLFGTTLEVRRGEVVALMGRNGMGKTTTVYCVMGVLQPLAGTIVFDGKNLKGLPPHKIARRGIGLVPEGRQIFPTLTVRENLVATAANYGDLDKPWTLERVFELLPHLSERRQQFAGTLSGGEQQMLAIGRALMVSPKLLILDEATEGLAPLIRDQIWSCLTRLKAGGQSILVIDKNIDELDGLADRAYVMEKGRIAWQGALSELRDNEAIKLAYLGV